MTGSIGELRERDGLLLVDVQLDFCPGGALPIAGGGKAAGRTEADR